MPMRSLRRLVGFQNFDDAVRHAAGHVGHRAFGPLPGDGGLDAAFHPWQIDLRALQIRPGGFK